MYSNNNISHLNSPPNSYLPLNMNPSAPPPLIQEFSKNPMIINENRGRPIIEQSDRIFLSSNRQLNNTSRRSTPSPPNRILDIGNYHIFNTPTTQQREINQITQYNSSPFISTGYQNILTPVAYQPFSPKAPQRLSPNRFIEYVYIN